MHGIYTYIPETNCVPREYNVAAILLLLFMVLISLVSVGSLMSFACQYCLEPVYIIIHKIYIKGTIFDT